MNKDKLQQQLDEMKAKVAEMELELSEPEKFELEYEEEQTYFLTDIGISSFRTGKYSEYLKHGRYRQTKEGAELSLARNKRANLLEALVEQVGRIKEFAVGETNYYITYVSDQWDFGRTAVHYEPEKVYMDEDTAIKVCEILNSGEYSIEKV